MSVQVFLQGHLRGIEEFLLSPAHESELRDAGPAGEFLFCGRSRWVSLLSEVLPLALLSELGLSKVLLGSSGGGQFLVVLPGEELPRAENVLKGAAEGVRQLSGGRLELCWASTENLGDWSIVRKRLAAGMDQKRRIEISEAGGALFEPFDPPEPVDTGGYFTAEMGKLIQEATTVGWSPETPARILVGEGRYTWSLAGSPEAIPLARHAAPGEGDNPTAGVKTLASRAQGRRIWGVLRGEVDQFAGRLRRLQTIEEHVQFSTLYKRFFAGELEVLCSLPEFWRKVSILFAGASDFAVCGSWDALVLLAREVQRLFHRFNEENLKEIPGAAGKTISMALSLAPVPEASLAEVYLEAGRELRIANSSGVDCFHVFGHTVEWRHLSQAAELQNNLGRLVREFGGSPQLLGDLIRFYKQAGASAGKRPNDRFDRPWRYHRRLSLLGGGARDRDFQKLRTKLVNQLIGKGAAQTRLRPAGRVALEWAKLLAEV